MYTNENYAPIDLWNSKKIQDKPTPYKHSLVSWIKMQCVVLCNQDSIHSIIICIRLHGRKEIKCWNIHNFFVIFHEKKLFSLFSLLNISSLFFRIQFQTIFRFDLFNTIWINVFIKFAPHIFFTVNGVKKCA